MAERRMFAKAIIDSDMFLDMPLSTQALYFHLAMRADDDGFINNPKKIKRMIGASDDDLKMLIAKQFLIPFNNGVVVIKHWRIHNYIRKDTYKGTMYVDEKERLTTKSNEEYELISSPVANPSRERDGNVTTTLQLRDEPVTDTLRERDEPLTQYSIDKISIDKNTLSTRAHAHASGCVEQPKTQKFIPPTVEEVRAYCNERNNGIDPEEFVSFYESKGWMIGRNKMKNWKSAIITWEKNRKQREQPSTVINDAEAYNFDWDKLRENYEHG